MFANPSPLAGAIEPTIFATAQSPIPRRLRRRNGRLERIRLELPLDAHRFGDELEIVGGHFDLAEAERCTPLSLVPYEGQGVDERLDWRLFRLEKVHINPVRLEIFCHLDLIDLACRYQPDGREGLQRLAIGGTRFEANTLPAHRPLAGVEAAPFSHGRAV